jgi:hypothetical protein
MATAAHANQWQCQQGLVVAKVMMFGTAYVQIVPRQQLAMYLAYNTNGGDRRGQHHRMVSGCITNVTV